MSFKLRVASGWILNQMMPSIMLSFWLFKVSCQKWRRRAKHKCFSIRVIWMTTTSIFSVIRAVLGMFASIHLTLGMYFEWNSHPLSWTFFQKIGRTGRVLPPFPANYYYIFYFCIENFLFIYERSCDLDENYIDNPFRQQKVDYLFQMARLVVIALR